MDSEFFVELALKKERLSQKELAQKVGVSPTQVTKWKQGEPMSLEMQKKFRSLTGIGELNPRVVSAVGSVEQAAKWENLIRFLADNAEQAQETGYNTEPLQHEVDLLTPFVFSCFEDLGIEIPDKLPQEIDFDFENNTLESEEQYEAVISENPYSSAIYSAFCNLNDLYGFYVAYIAELMFHENISLLNSEVENIEPNLLRLAFAKLELDSTFAPNLKSFRSQVLKDFERWINTVKREAWQAGVPIREELMKLVNADSDVVGFAAERESLGINTQQIHPDVYMNELLVGMRAIHQVLPAILEKLDIKDFELNTEDLTAR